MRAVMSQMHLSARAYHSIDQTQAFFDSAFMQRLFYLTRDIGKPASAGDVKP